MHKKKGWGVPINIEVGKKKKDEGEKSCPFAYLIFPLGEKKKSFLCKQYGWARAVSGGSRGGQGWVEHLLKVYKTPQGGKVGKSPSRELGNLSRRIPTLDAFTIMSDLNPEDLSLPKATVQKIVSEILPPDLVFSRESRDALIECCVMFIIILSTTSNDVAEKESKKTIACEHVIKALEELDFPDYIEPIQQTIASHKESLKVRERKVGKLDQLGKSEEELLREQELLFANSRQRMMSAGSVPKQEPTAEEVKQEALSESIKTDTTE